MKKLLKIALALCTVLMITGCQNNPKRQLEEFLYAQSTKSFSSGEIEGSISIGMGIQQIPIEINAKYDLNKWQADLTLSMMGMTNAHVIVYDKMAYIDLMTMKIKVPIGEGFTLTSSEQQTPSPEEIIQKFIDSIVHLSAKTEDGKKIFTFEIDVVSLKKKLPGEYSTELDMMLTRNPQFTITGDKHNNLESVEMTWSLGQFGKISGRFDFKNIGGNIVIEEPSDKDSYQEMQPEEFINSLES